MTWADRQEALRAKIAEVEVLSKTEAKIGGIIVTLDKTTGTLSCPVHHGEDNCWHIRRLLEVARPRRR